MAKCKRCGKEMLFVKTKIGGKPMPCDIDPVYYKEGGKGKIVTPNGEVLRATIMNEEDDLSTATGWGYRPHWGSCPYADEFRKRGK